MTLVKVGIKNTNHNETIDGLRSTYATITEGSALDIQLEYKYKNVGGVGLKFKDGPSKFSVNGKEFTSKVLVDQIEQFKFDNVETDKISVKVLDPQVQIRTAEVYTDGTPVRSTTSGFACIVVQTGTVGRRWLCTRNDGTASWYAGSEYKYNGVLARDAILDQTPSPPLPPAPPAPSPSPQPEPPSPAPVPAPTGNKDAQGITMIMPSKVGGKYITNFELETKWRNYRSGKTSEWSIEYTSHSGTPLTAAESTYYVKIDDFKKEEDTISFKRRGGRHSSDNPTEGTCYDSEVSTFGKDEKNLEVERPHPSMHSNHQKILNHIGENLIGKWIGVKVIDINVKENGKDAVYLAQYVDFPVADINNPPNNWRKRYEVVDSGQLDKGLILKPFGDISVVRIDGVGKESTNKDVKPKPPTFKYASVREVVKN